MENPIRQRELTVKRGSKKYPNEVVSYSKAGKEEARILKKKGTFVIYNYEDVFSNTVDKKYSILLKDENGDIEHLFIVPMDEKEIVVKHVKEGKVKRKLWDPRLKTATEF